MKKSSLPKNKKINLKAPKLTMPLPDAIVGGVVLFFCTFFFCFHRDFYLTLNQSLDFLDSLFSGDVLHYYTYIRDRALANLYPEWGASLLAGANYSIFNYAVLGIWCLPVYLLYRGILNVAVPFAAAQFWAKLGFFLLYLWMGKLLHQILEAADPVESKEDTKTGLKGRLFSRSRVGVYFLLSPILLFSSAMISHLDLFSVVLLLLGIRALFRNKYPMAILFFACACAFKPFVLLSIAPILLLREKRIHILLLSFAGVVAGVLPQTLLYGKDPGYVETKAFMNANYFFIDRFFDAGVPFNRNFLSGTGSYFVILFFVICIAAYLDNGKHAARYFAFPCYVWLGFFAFVQWHPNWILHLAPFLVLLLPYVSDLLLWSILQTAFAGIYMLISTVGWAGYYDVTMVNYGLLGGVLPHSIAENSPLLPANMLSRLFPGMPIADILASVGLGIAAVLAIYIWHETKGGPVRRREESGALTAGYAIIFVLPIVAFVGYALACCFVG